MLNALHRLKRLILYLFWFFPIRSNRIIYLCYSGTQYSCSPKYISMAIQEKFENRFEQVWVYDSEKVRRMLPGYLHSCKKNSIIYFYFILTSKVIITNVTLPKITPFRKEQIKIDTWHGTAFKGDTNKFKNNYNENDFFIAENQLTHDVFKRKDSFNYQGKILNIGMPRNDILIRGEGGKVEEVKKKLGVRSNIKILFYAPTFRDSGNADCFRVDFRRLVIELEAKFGGKWVVLCRFHHMQKEESNSTEGIDVSEYPDMQELLLCADILITDYSSCMWDFSLMDKPVFLYASDIDDYIENERGDFYFPLKELPFPIARSNNELIEAVQSFQRDKYSMALKVYQKKMGRFNYSGDATYKLIEMICNFT